jgi:hypothetical protein
VSDGATIGRLRLLGRDPGEGPVALRLRLERLLAGDTLRPPGLGAGEVLIVRGLRRAAPLGQARPAPAWGAMLRAELGELARGAARPALGPPPPDAQAVRFADMAELLACLTRDLLAGRGGAWYWRRLHPNIPGAPGAGLRAAWASHARALPAALGLLAPAEVQRAGQAIAVHEAHAVLRALWAAFELPSPPPPALGAARPAGGAHPPASHGEASVLPPAPALLAERSGGLAPEVARLLALAVALRVAPALVRTPGGAAQFATPPPGLAGAPPAMPQAHVAPLQPVPSAPSTNPAIGAVSPTPELAHERTADVRTEPTATHGVPNSTPPASPPPAAPGADGGPDSPGTPPVSQERAALERQLTAGDGAGSLSTRLGGAFYLINLLAWLELPGGWGADQPLPAQLGGWGLVEVLARGLLGHAAAAHNTDPLWELLAELAGRPPGTLLGAGLATPGFFAPPERLVRRLGLAALPATPLAPDAAADLAPAAAWWLSRLLPWALAVLARLDVARSAEEAGAALAVPAAIERSRTHLDVTLPLDRIALPVRRAGLDCSPGWAPDLGLIVTLHFR